MASDQPKKKGLARRTAVVAGHNATRPVRGLFKGVYYLFFPITYPLKNWIFPFAKQVLYFATIYVFIIIPLKLTGRLVRWVGSKTVGKLWGLGVGLCLYMLDRARDSIKLETWRDRWLPAAGRWYQRKWKVRPSDIISRRRPKIIQELDKIPDGDVFE